MLNIYKYYQDAKSLPLYNELGSHLKLLDNSNQWMPEDAKKLEPIKHIIMQNATNAYKYAKNVLHSRWKEAEPYILKNTYTTVRYVQDIIKEPCPEIEHELTGTYASLYYVNGLMGGDWSDFDGGKHAKNAWYHQDILIMIKEIYKSFDRDDVDISEIAIRTELDGNMVSIYDGNNDRIGQIIKSGYNLSFQKANKSLFAGVEDYRNVDNLYDKMYDFINGII